MFSILSFLLAILALSFLIFIHELGHYFMARRVGMRVEVFSIGFGRAIYSWMRDGVKWQIGWLPFGGYVRIAGTDSDKDKDPYAVKDGFFGKSPWDRIKVSFMGPFVNLVFGLLAFTLLWMAGGREKNFSEYTHKIGYVDPKSELYERGIRPGDEITYYNDVPFTSAKDHLYQPLVSKDVTEVKGFRVNYLTKDKTPFEYKVKNYPHPYVADKGIVTAGILSSASNIIFDKLPHGQENPLPEGSPLIGSGIQYGDRVVWVDGHLIYSVPQMTEILNDERVLLTVQRGNQTLLVRVPRIQVQEFRLDADVKEEIIDWQYEAELKAIKTQNLFILPYNLTNECVIEGPLKFIDKDNELAAFPAKPDSYLEAPLQTRDRIIAVDGSPVKYSFQVLRKLQNRHVSIIVERDSVLAPRASFSNADQNYDDNFKVAEIEEIVSTLGTKTPKIKTERYVLLNSVEPRMRSDLVLSPEKDALYKTQMIERRRQIDAIEDAEKRQEALSQLEARQKEFVIGMPMIQDKRVEYNPGPIDLFTGVVSEIWHTLGALFSGTLNPKWLSGPVGIIQVVQSQAMLSFNDMLFWVGAISINLGILNLLPIPMLDGGTIVFSLFEMITKIKIKPAILEKMILPFAILLILFFLFVTYHDVERIFGGFLK